MKNNFRFSFILACLVLGLSAPTLAQLPDLPLKKSAPTPGNAAPTAAIPGAPSPSPELTGQLTKELGITQDQAVGGSGALFGLAKSRLKPEEFGKVSSAVPGMDGLLAAAPKSPLGAASPLGAMGSALPGAAGSLAGLAPVAGSFKSLGLSPDMAAKFVPVLTNFVSSKGGAATASLLSGVLK